MRNSAKIFAAGDGPGAAGRAVRHGPTGQRWRCTRRPTSRSMFFSAISMSAVNTPPARSLAERRP